MPESTLKDDVPYASVDDAERFLRGQDFTAVSEISESDMQEWLDEASEAVDTRTNRAWRRRHVQDREFRVEFDASTQSAYSHRHRRVAPHRGVRPIQRRGEVNLPHMRVTINTNEPDHKVVVLEPEGTTDITSDKGRDSEWILDDRRGRLKINAGNFRTGPIRGSGLMPDPRVRVSYWYGTDEDGNDVSQSAPDDIRQATLQLMADMVINTDRYSEVTPGGEDGVNPQQAAQTYREAAYDTLDRYRQTKMVL